MLKAYDYHGEASGFVHGAVRLMYGFLILFFGPAAFFMGFNFFGIFAIIMLMFAIIGFAGEKIEFLSLDWENGEAVVTQNSLFTLFRNKETVYLPNAIKSITVDWKRTRGFTAPAAEFLFSDGRRKFVFGIVQDDDAAAALEGFARKFGIAFYNKILGIGSA